MSKPELEKLRIAGLVSLEIGREARRILMEQLGAGYEKAVAVFINAIKSVQLQKRCDAVAAAVEIGLELNRTGHFTLLVPAALAELLESVA
jgi:hypothetical protein